jgi:CRP-like cAMP-binding protein
MARIADRLREGQWMVISVLGMGIVGLVYGLSTSIPLAIVMVMISGFMNAPLGIARRLIFQRNTPRELRGRVASPFAVGRDLVFVLGMAGAGLADVIDLRILVVISSVILLGSAALTQVMPGLGQPAAEWRRAVTLLRAAPMAAVSAAGRRATAADLEALTAMLPSLAALDARRRDDAIAWASVAEIPAGTPVIRQGETGDAAYFILAGRAVAGIPTEDGGVRSLAAMTAGDCFGEIGALTGSVRTANVVADGDSRIMEVPAATLREMMAIPEISALILGKLNERLTRTTSADLPRLAGLDQSDLRDLRRRRGTALPKSYEEASSSVG